MLIATLPALYRQDLVHQILANPLVDQVRYNTGMVSHLSVSQTLELLLELSVRYNKKIWLDLKGRQLRIIQWSMPNYGKILLNHNVQVDLPAKIYFRHDQSAEIKFVKDNEIFVDPPPAQAIGAGQSVNILGDNLKVEGYLTGKDIEFLETAKLLNVSDFMLSFIEEFPDIAQVLSIIPEANLVLKIETPKGLEFIKTLSPSFLNRYHLLTARDDLSINLGEQRQRIISAMQDILSLDSEAIVGSHIFISLLNSDMPFVADYSDVYLCHQLGYKNFLLCDDVCNFYFDLAIKAWQEIQTIL